MALKIEGIVDRGVHAQKPLAFTHHAPETLPGVRSTSGQAVQSIMRANVVAGCRSRGPCFDPAASSRALFVLLCLCARRVHD